MKRLILILFVLTISMQIGYCLARSLNPYSGRLSDKETICPLRSDFLPDYSSSGMVTLERVDGAGLIPIVWFPAYINSNDIYDLGYDIPSIQDVNYVDMRFDQKILNVSINSGDYVKTAIIDEYTVQISTTNLAQTFCIELSFEEFPIYISYDKYAMKEWPGGW